MNIWSGQPDWSGYSPISGLDHEMHVLDIHYQPLGYFDGDGEVTLNDYSELSACLSGSGTEYTEDCLEKDLDKDGHVDLADFALFQNACIDVQKLNRTCLS